VTPAGNRRSLILRTAPLAQSSLARSNREPVQSADAKLASALLSLCREAIARHQGREFVEAIATYERILALLPDIHKHFGHAPAAAPIHERIRALLPDIHNNFGHALSAVGRHEPAAAAFARAIELKADFPEALCNWGLALVSLDRFEEAEAKYRKAIAVNPRFPGAYNNLGLLLKERGRLAEAREAFEQAIAHAPRNFSYYDNLAAVRAFVAGDPYVAALEAAARDAAALPPVEQMHLNFALARAYDHLDRPHDAFPRLIDANRLKRAQVTYDEPKTLAMMERLRTLITRDFIAARAGCGEPSARPIFIVGMTRSGTTLIEQILASHPQVHGAGEVALLDQVTGSMRNLLPGVPVFPDMMLAMTGEHFRALGEAYLQGMSERAPQAARITDKMTVNFLFVGLIHLALPNAAIIHAVRDAGDTCVSNFATHFTAGHEHTYDLAELGRYYRHYRQLMAHWHAVLPGRIMDVRYEELVGDLEGVARRIVAHCGLAWDARCLDFHRAERSIRTASAAQVRKPIYRDSVARWRKYQAFLGPLFEELGPFAPSAGEPASPEI
jgi:tetratricopeptide (TPR) repeat protein